MQSFGFNNDEEAFEIIRYCTESAEATFELKPENIIKRKHKMQRYKQAEECKEENKPNTQDQSNDFS